MNANVLMGFRAPEIQQQEPQANALMRAYQVKAMADQSDMNALKAQEYRRGVESENALNEAYRGSVGPNGQVDRTKLYSSLAQGGQGSKLPGIQKQFADADKTEAERQAKLIEIGTKRADHMGQSMGWLRQNPSIQNAQAVVANWVQTGIIQPEQAQAAIAAFQADPTPEGIARQAELGFRTALNAKDQLAQFQTRNTGGTTDTIAVDPVSQQARVVNSVQNTQSPDAILQAQTSDANNRRSVGAQYDLNRATREAAATQAAATRDAAQIRRDQDTEMKLADDYRAQSKPFKEVSDAYKIISTSLDKATTSPAATLAGATKFMKLLDPGSVVRESELGMALAATGVLDRAANYYNTLRLGKVLTPQQAADFKNIAGQIYTAAQKQQQLIDQDYKKKADTYKLRPDMITQDLGQNKAVPVDLGSLPSGGKGGGKVIDFGSLE